MASQAVLDLIISLEGDKEAAKGLVNVGNAAGAVGGAMKGLALGGLAVAGAGLAGFGAIMGVAMNEAADAEAGLAQLNAVLESTGGAAGVTTEEMLALSAELSAANGMSKFTDDAILQSQNLLLTFTNIRGDMVEEATRMSADMAQALGGDPVSQATALGKALNDPIAGITALTRVGVTFTEDQKKVIASLVETGDVAGAQRIILDELNREFGGSAAAAADTFSGKMITLQEKLNTVAEGIGTSLLPLMTQVVDTLSSPEAMAGVQAFADALTNGIGAAVDWLTTTGIPMLQTAWQLIVDGVTTFQQAISGDWVDSGIIHPFHRVIGVIGQVVAAFGEDGLSGAFAVLLPYAQQAFGALLAWVQEQLPGWLATLQSWAAAAWQWLSDAIPPLLEAAGRAFVGLLEWVQGQLPGWMAKLGEWATAAVVWLSDAIPPLLLAAADFLAALLKWGNEEVIPKLIEIGGEMAEALYEWIINDLIPEIGPKLGEFMWEMDQKIRNEIIPQIETAALALGSAVIGGVVSAIKNGATAVITAIQEVMSGMIEAALRSIVSRSPSRVFMEIGGYAMEGLALGIAQNAMLPALATADAMSSMIDAAAMTSLPTVASTFGMGSSFGSFDGSSAPAGNTIVMHNTFNVANDMDVEAVAYRIAQVFQTRR